MSDAYSPSASSWTGAKSGDSEVWEAEEELLNSTFEACDSDNTGVSPSVPLSLPLSVCVCVCVCVCVLCGELTGVILELCVCVCVCVCVVLCGELTGVVLELCVCVCVCVNCPPTPVPRAGCVSAVQIVGYLRGVTGQPQDDGPLRRLCRLLDPQETGRGLPRERFLSVMRAWVQECRQKGSEADEGDVGFIETISLLQPGRLIEGDVSPWESRGGEGHRGNGEEVEVIVQTLQEAHRRLSERNAALQRAIEAGEEERGREREERQALRVKLRDSQHALQQAQTLREELEDLKNIVRGHEERERDGERKKKTLEREIQTLTAQLNDLQLENESLLTEREELREREAELSREREGLLVLLEETQRELACRDALLSQDGRERDRLQENEEEYCATIAELKAEIASLREKLGPGGGGGLETCVREPLSDGALGVPVSLHCEIERAQLGTASGSGPGWAGHLDPEETDRPAETVDDRAPPRTVCVRALSQQEVHPARVPPAVLGVGDAHWRTAWCVCVTLCLCFCALCCTTQLGFGPSPDRRYCVGHLWSPTFSVLSPQIDLRHSHPPPH
ncbi:protein KASH5-like isoform X2 [Lepisosteus oculatus]|uniref:protein KASH5-like isoform X2 n=1 Tax=Lepisosteus oculatus TaxID=7918 RepID=UPI003713EF29